MANVLNAEKQISIIHHLVEGNSIRATSRLCRVHRDTIRRLLNEVGPACNNFMDLSFCNLKLRHIQIDETWTFVGKKQGKLIDEEKNDPTMGDIYLYLALDEDSRLIPAYVLGKRNSENTEAMADLLAERLVRCPGMFNHVQISTDGFPAYPTAIRDAFGDDVQHGVLIKNYADPEVGRYAPPSLIRANRRNVQNIDDISTVCTSHVERANLTIRTFMRRFTRLAMGFSKKLENLESAVQLFLCYYNFCWQPREKGTRGRLRNTPAMMAGLSDHVWKVEEMVENVMGLEQDRLAYERYARLLNKLNEGGTL